MVQETLPCGYDEECENRAPSHGIDAETSICDDHIDAWFEANTDLGE